MSQPVPTDPGALALLEQPPVDLVVSDTIPDEPPAEWFGCYADQVDVLVAEPQPDQVEQTHRVMSLLAAASTTQYSQNGWVASADRNALGIRTFAVPGRPDVLVPLRADVAPLLLAFAAWWDQNVEPLVVPGNWGYAYRDIRGASGLSNHASGTAIDLNAPRHPLGAVGTVPAAKRAAIEAKAASLGLRWGGSYSGRKDEMHAEVVVSHARAMQLVAALQATPPAAPPAAGQRTLQQGSSGEDVKVVQRAVGVSADGVFGPKTTSAVKSYQGARGLSADGIVGPKTWAAILAPPPAPAPTSRPTLRRGSKGQAVKDLQARLNARYPAYSKLVADGDFGGKTDGVVREFQRRAGLAVDGVVGAKTWAALGF